MDYSEWFLKNWYKTGGLLSPSNAGKITGLTGARMTQIWKEKNLEIYQFDKKDKPLLGWNDFLNFKTERDSKKENE